MDSIGYVIILYSLLFSQFLFKSHDFDFDLKIEYSSALCNIFINLAIFIMRQ